MKMWDMKLDSKALLCENTVTSFSTFNIQTSTFHPMKFLLTLVLLVSTALTASAQPYDITLYTSGFGVVKDTRSMTLRAGMNRVEVTGLPHAFDPNSLFTLFNGTLNSASMGMERPTSASILTSRIGKKVTLIGADHTFTGVVDRYQNGVLILKLADGSLLSVTNPGSFHVAVDSLPAVFTTYPAVTVDLNARRAGRQDVGLIYKTKGFKWTASYVVVLDENGTTGRLSGFARIDNNTGMDFRNATVRLLAGDIYRSGGGRNQAPMYREVMAMASADSERKMVEESVGDVHLYTLDKPFDLMTGVQTRIPLVEESAIKHERRYRYMANGNSTGIFRGSLAQVLYDIPNTTAASLGKPLPAGQVSVYTRSGDRITLTGEATIPHTAVDGLVRLVTGTAFDILVKEDPTRQDRIRDNVFDNHYSVSVKNTKREAIVVEVAMSLNPNTSITRSTIPATMEGNVALFSVSLRAGEEKKVEFTVRNSY